MSGWSLHRSYRQYACDTLVDALRAERVATWSAEGSKGWHFWMGLAEKRRRAAAAYYLKVFEYSVFTDNCGFDEPGDAARQAWAARPTTSAWLCTTTDEHGVPNWS